MPVSGAEGEEVAPVVNALGTVGPVGTDVPVDGAAGGSSGAGSFTVLGQDGACPGALQTNYEVCQVC